MIEIFVVLSIVAVIAYKHVGYSFSYLFNEFGYDNYIKDPWRQFVARQTWFKNTKFYDFDIANIHEAVFDIFKAYVNSRWNVDFVRQAVLNGSRTRVNDDHYWEEKYSDLMRLEQARQYVLYIREENKATFEYISDLFLKAESFQFVDIDRIDEEGIPLKELRRKKTNYYITGNYWFDGDVLKHCYEKCESDCNCKSAYFDIENELNLLDIKYAKEIIELKDYLWD